MSYVVEESWSTNNYMVGYGDGRLEGLKCLPGINEHYSECFDARQDAIDALPDPWVSELPDRPERAIALGTIQTRYITLYRVHSKRHFKWGRKFPRNWPDDRRKRRAKERFSPPGTVGHYFGVTADAALDEAYYYGHGQIDSRKQFFLALECFLDNILYLTDLAVLTSVWKVLGLDPRSTADMYFAVMDLQTDNTITNKIGVWARDRGLSGLIFPSARYGQRLDLAKQREDGGCPFPVVNTVPIGSHMDELMVQNSGLSGQLLYDTAKQQGGKPIPVYAEPNLVLFSGQQVRALDRAVFYSCASMEHRENVMQIDKRHQLKSYDHWLSL